MRSSRHREGVDRPMPRVLVVSVNRVNESDNGSTAFLVRNLFGDWPRTHLAQVFSGHDNGDRGFMGSYHQMGVADRSGGRLFYALKSRVGAPPGSGVEARGAGSPRLNSSTGMVRRLLANGLYEWPFPVTVSDRMAVFVSHFKPDLVYATGYTLGFSRLPVAISKRFNLPLVFHTFDDWAGTLGSRGPLRPVAERMIHSAALRLVHRATLRWAFNEPMAAEYRRRFGREFIVVPNGDDPARFPPLPAPSPGPRVIGVFGSLTDRWSSLILLAKAVEGMPVASRDIHIKCFATSLPEDARKQLTRFRRLELLPAPSHANAPAAMASCHNLVILESFEARRASEIGLSVSTKAHLFMFARRPVLIIAPATSGVAKYARSHGWALAVTDPSVAAVRRALSDLWSCPREVHELVERAYRVGLLNHDIRKIRSSVARQLVDITERQSWNPSGS